MITRLVEAHYAQHAQAPEDVMVDFWLRELRSPAILIEVAGSAPHVCQRLKPVRPLLEHAAAGSEALLATALRAEEDVEREADRHYWAPLKRELEQLRLDRRRQTPEPPPT
jgi:hypothetical protein